MDKNDQMITKITQVAESPIDINSLPKPTEISSQVRRKERFSTGSRMTAVEIFKSAQNEAKELRCV